MVKKHGADQAIKALSKVKVVDLRSLAREYNGEFGIAGREIRNANKKVLIEEFSKLFSK
jgi:Ran GTPase-activating protein (RanGAP) involved in mRNA processing and transport